MKRSVVYEAKRNEAVLWM